MSRNCNTAAGGRLFRGENRPVTTDAIDGKSVGFGRLPSNPVGTGVRPVSITWWPIECSL